MAIKIYTKKDLLIALKKNGLPHSYKTLLKYEGLGILDRGGELVSRNHDRFYTKDEIKRIVEVVKSHKQPSDEL